MDTGAHQVLVVGVGPRICALPLAVVEETMRPLPIDPVPGAPGFVRGLSMIRGVSVPVVDLGLVLGGVALATATRLLALRVGDRRVAVLVDRVVGIRDLDAIQLEPLPPLLRDAGAEVIESIGALDQQLLMVLRAARLVPADPGEATAA